MGPTNRDGPDKQGWARQTGMGPTNRDGPVDSSCY